MRILVIEDDKELLYAVETILKVEGYKVDTALSVHSAKSMLTENKYDLVITDIMLPYFGGFDLVDEAKKNGDKVPVIVITGMDEEILSNTITFAEKCITKPFGKQELLDAVNFLLNK